MLRYITYVMLVIYHVTFMLCYITCYVADNSFDEIPSVVF